MAKALIFFADGFEEVEALTVVDLLRRAKVEVDMVSITKEKTVTGSHNIAIGMDKLIEEVDFASADALILPGGMPGTRNLEKHALLKEELKKANEAGKLLCAICAAPLVLGVNHILEGKQASCYPSFEEELLGARVSFDPVSHEGNVITSRGLGTAIAFASEIIATLCSEEEAKNIEESIIYSR